MDELISEHTVRAYTRITMSKEKRKKKKKRKKRERRRKLTMFEKEKNVVSAQRLDSS